MIKPLGRFVFTPFLGALLPLDVFTVCQNIQNKLENFLKNLILTPALPLLISFLPYCTIFLHNKGDDL